MFTKPDLQVLEQDKNRIVSAKSICVGRSASRQIPAIRNQVVMRFGNFPVPLSIRRLRRVGAKWHGVKCREPHADVHSRRRERIPCSTSRKIACGSQNSAILSFSRMRAKKFVPQVPVAMLDVHEVETQLTRHSCRAMKVFNDRTDFAVGQDWIVVRQSQSSIQDRVMIKDARLRPVMCIRTAVASGMASTAIR